MTDTDRTTQITRVGTVIVHVGDQDRALEFYLGKLGFEKRLDGPFGEGGRWVEVAPRPREAADARSRRRRGAHAHGRVRAADVHLP